jgi:hypothetical protein
MLLAERASRTQSNRKWCLVGFAAVLAVLWAITGTFDDFYGADVGPAMRRELGAFAYAYTILAPLESVAPIAVVLAWGLKMLKKPRQWPNGGRSTT